MSRPLRLSCAILLSLFSGACSDADTHPSAPNQLGAGAGGAPVVLPAHSSNGTNSEPSCAAVAQTARPSFRPIDVIFAIDNSSSMAEEILEVQRRINQDFARIIEQSGLDYRVIVVSRYGDVNTPVGESERPVCIGAPLGGTDCAHAVSGPPTNSARFFHYSADVGSHDAWCVLLSGLSRPDEYGMASRGYSQFLRQDAFKVFVVVSDDDPACQGAGVELNDRGDVAAGQASAELFDRTLRRMSPAQFGSATARNYVFHSIVGVAAGPEQRAWLPSAAVQTSTCGAAAEGPGTGYQSLSKLTGGLRYPSCDPRSFDVVFEQIARGIVADNAMSCEWEIPAPPSGKLFDQSRVNVRFASSAAKPQTLPHVGSRVQCGDRAGWYYDNDSAPTRVVACPSSCQAIQRDPAARVDVLFGCATETLIK